MRFFAVILVLLNLSCLGQGLDSLAQLNLDSLDRMIQLARMQPDTCVYFSIEDTNRNQYCLPENFVKPENWIRADESRMKGEFYGGVYPKSYKMEDALAAIDTARQFGNVCAAKSWCVKNYTQVFPFLVARLAVKEKVGLESTADLIIWDRMSTGELMFYGHGGCIQEDLFTVAGRASWILNEITGEKFAIVHCNMSVSEALEFKRQWLAYLKAAGYKPQAASFRQ